MGGSASGADPVRLGARLAAEGLAPLSGCTPEGLARELIAHGAEWDLNGYAGALMTRPLLVVSSDDGLAKADQALVDALRTKGAKRVTSLHFPTDHSYSDHRIALSAAVIEWLGTVEKMQ